MTLINPYQQLTHKQRTIFGIGSIITLLILWSIISAMGVISPNKLPTPWSVANALSYLSYHEGESLLLNATMWSVGRVATAGVLVIIVGIPIGILMGASPKINAVMSPLLDPFRSAPVVAFLPIIVMWLGIGESMKITFLFLGAVVYLIPMVRDAIQSVPQSYWVSALDLGATRFEAIRKAVVPMAMPRIADAVIVSISIMWTYITVAEYVNAKEGLGQLIQNARRFSAMDQVFAGIIVIVALALITYQTMKYIKAKAYPWETYV